MHRRKSSSTNRSIHFCHIRPPHPGDDSRRVVLMITLGNDSNGDITSVEFSVATSDGVLGSESISLTKLQLSSGAAASLSPIYGYTVNIVGFGGSTNTDFSSGSGTIAYSSQNLLQTDTDASPGSGFSNWIQPATGETSNTNYGGSIVHEDGSTIYTQMFSVHT